jgi:hypothetical protein
MNRDSQLQSNLLEEPKWTPSIDAAPSEGAAAPGVVGADPTHRASGGASPGHTPQRRILTLKGKPQSGRTGLS